MEMLRHGLPPIVEDRIGELTSDVVKAGLLTVTEDVNAAVANSDISLVCVGTPSTGTGNLSTAFLEQVTAQIGAALREKAVGTSSPTEAPCFPAPARAC